MFSSFVVVFSFLRVHSFACCAFRVRDLGMCFTYCSFFIVFFSHRRLMTDLFQSQEHAERYLRFRPSYPDELFEKIVTFWKENAVPHSRLGCCVDIGCGSGQSTVPLARLNARYFLFSNIYGLDVSASQIAHAQNIPHPLTGLPSIVYQLVCGILSRNFLSSFCSNVMPSFSFSLHVVYDRVFLKQPLLVLHLSILSLLVQLYIGLIFPSFSKKSTESYVLVECLRHLPILEKKLQFPSRSLCFEQGLRSLVLFVHVCPRFHVLLF